MWFGHSRAIDIVLGELTPESSCSSYEWLGTVLTKEGCTQLDAGSPELG